VGRCNHSFQAPAYLGRSGTGSQAVFVVHQLQPTSIERLILRGPNSKRVRPPDSGIVSRLNFHPPALSASTFSGQISTPQSTPYFHAPSFLLLPVERIQDSADLCLRVRSCLLCDLTLHWLQCQIPSPDQDGVSAQSRDTMADACNASLFGRVRWLHNICHGQADLLYDTHGSFAARTRDGQPD
jgi:hypothetical protein